MNVLMMRVGGHRNVICPIAEDVCSYPLTEEVSEEGFHHKVTLFPSVFSIQYVFCGKVLNKFKGKERKKLYINIVLHQTSPCIYLHKAMLF